MESASAGYLDSDTSRIGDFTEGTPLAGREQIADEDLEPGGGDAVLNDDLAQPGLQQLRPVVDAPVAHSGPPSAEEIVLQTMQELRAHVSTTLQRMNTRLQAIGAVGHEAAPRVDLRDHVTEPPGAILPASATTATRPPTEAISDRAPADPNAVEQAADKHVMTIINIALDASRTDLELAADLVGGGLKVVRIDPGARLETKCPDCNKIMPSQRDLKCARHPPSHSM